MSAWPPTRSTWTFSLHFSSELALLNCFSTPLLYHGFPPCQDPFWKFLKIFVPFLQFSLFLLFIPLWISFFGRLWHKVSRRSQRPQNAAENTHRNDQRAEHGLFPLLGFFTVYEALPDLYATILALFRWLPQARYLVYWYLPSYAPSPLAEKGKSIRRCNSKWKCW